VKRNRRGDVDLLFLGDSITQGWADNAVWKKHYGGRKAANFGIGGDTTQNVLWRIDNGEIDSIKPKAIVLMIGTNNFGLKNDKPEDVAKGVEKIVGTLRSKLPAAKILLLGIFPRDAKPETDFRKRIAATNEKLARLADGKAVTYLDLGAKFLDSAGYLPADVMPDYLHLSEKGYRIWAEGMEEKVKNLLGEG
jgi:beta-glucosidase